MIDFKMLGISALAGIGALTILQTAVVRTLGLDEASAQRARATNMIIPANAPANTRCFYREFSDRNISFEVRQGMPSPQWAMFEPNEEFRRYFPENGPYWGPQELLKEIPCIRR